MVPGTVLLVNDIDNFEIPKNLSDDVRNQLIDRKRALQLSYDPAGKTLQIEEGISAVKIERGFNRQLIRDPNPAYDYIDSGDWGVIEIKGPLPENGKGSLTGLANKIIKELMDSSQIFDTMVVDTANLTPAQIDELKQLISGAVAATTKKIKYVS